MKKNYLLSILLSVSLSLMTLSVFADSPIAFKPPQLGAPATRIGGGTRGLGTGGKVAVQVLAPSQTSYTSSSTPTLYWYLSDKSVREVEISITLDNQSEPVLEKNLGVITKAGVQSIRLSDFGVNLKPGLDYRWSIAVVNDPEQRSNDAFTSATVRLQSLSKPLTDPAALAAEGYWYDVLDQLITKKSSQVDLLLEQGGINLADIH